MRGQFQELESEWLKALQNNDPDALDKILDSAFVCTPWASDGRLMLKEEYLREVNKARFTTCGLNPVYVQTIGQFAIVRCRLSCDYLLEGRTWTVDMLVSDIWINREGCWKALNRAFTPASERRVAPSPDTFVEHQTEAPL